MEKTCKKCNEKKDLNLFVKNKKIKIGVCNTCKKCANTRTNLYRIKNSIKINKNKIKYDLLNPEKAKERSIKAIKVLGNSYLNKCLTQKGFTKEQITPELIEVQRIIIKTKRLCKTSKI